MATRISFTFEGDKQIDRTLERFELAATDASPVWEVLADRFAGVEKRHFDSVGTYGSGGWAPLSPAYARWKARRYPGKPIMQREGTLYDSLTRRPFGVEVIEAHLAVFGTGLEYPRYHQLGEGNNPVRKVVDLPAEERREWVKIIQRFLLTGRA